MSDDRSFHLLAVPRFTETVLLGMVGCPTCPGCPLVPGCRTYPMLRARARSFELDAEHRDFGLEAE